jgi:hypothetical protein
VKLIWPNHANAVIIANYWWTMFRPYNLKSIALWTAGSLAGNEAYYSTKERYSGARPSRPTVPPKVAVVAKRLEAIEQTFNSLAEAMKGTVTATQGRWDITDLVRFSVFVEWLSSRKEQIKRELRAAYEQAVARGHPSSESIAQAHQNIDSYVDVLIGLRAEGKEVLSRVILTDSGREIFYGLFRKFEPNYYVDELTCAVMSRKGQDRLIVTLQKEAS